ncbi:hypothetical protein QE152_g35740 [Popillia japonica]|uniref:Uncharacterized protein n=1 Tax=Popillia japonica TaxID=7064 RepID=A0AAW1IFA0_POPJA
MDDLYEDVSHVDLGSQISNLEEQNKILLNHINKLEEDIKKLCTELTNMKGIQQNLSRNISELFKTAKIELHRKDRMISELREEINSLIRNKGERYKKYKRKLHERDSNDAPKRFKSNSIGSEIERKSNSPARSTSRNDNVKTELHDIQEEDLFKMYRNYKNDNYNRNLRYSPFEDYGRYHRTDARYDSRGNYQRSRSNSKFRRSNSRDRYRKSSCRESDRRSDSRDKTIRKDIEDGEITPENDTLIIEENVEDTQYINNRQSDLSSKLESKPITIDEYRSRKKHMGDDPTLLQRQSNEHSKSNLQNLDDGEKLELTTNTNNKTEEETITNGNNKTPEAISNDNNKVQETRNCNNNGQQTSLVCNNKTQETKKWAHCNNNGQQTSLVCNNKTQETKKWAKVQEADTVKQCSGITEEKCVTNNELQNPIIENSQKTLNESNSKDLLITENNASIHEKTCNDFNSNTSNMLNESGNTSVNSDSSFLNNSENISNTSTINPTKIRRRRCVVIGLKEKT